ncbi:MAG TPA: cytochrome c oxidase subunit 3 [Alphaproteobacteria bacterium]|nr:cytochrome c oxidase subunit 3 [Alphaproteobacteria bacterium]
MKTRPALDVSQLPAYVFGPRGLMWWGTMGIVAIEGTMFVILMSTYFYMRLYVPEWPPNLPPPDLFYGTVNTLVLLASAVPNQRVKRAAAGQDLRRVRLGLVTCLAFAAAFLVLRAFEFTALNCSWDTNAYGSAVWMLLGFHTFHLATDALDTGALTALMFTRRIEAQRFVDVSENADYWYFVVGVWIPVYGVIYLAPRLL